MKLLIIGINHKTAPIALREQLAFAEGDIRQALQQLHSSHHICTINGGVILSTCNRTEIYAMASDIATKHTSEKNTQDTPPSKSKVAHLNDTTQYIIQWLSQFKSVPIHQLEPYLYIYKETQAINHWIRVAAGLDSMILGEPQILGQTKQAVSRSAELGYMSSQLSWVIDQVFSSAKQIRHETQVGKQAVTLGYATAKLATQIFDDVTECRLLLVASGEMNRLVANHIAGQGIKDITICNRSHDRASHLADELRHNYPNCQVKVKSLESLADCLLEADIVSSCTASMQTLISYKMTKLAIKKRRYRPMLMVDLAVPRDIEEKVNKLDEVYLYSIDDLQHVIAGNLAQRKQAAIDAEILASQLVVDIKRRFLVKQVSGDIQFYRQTAHEQADKLLQATLKRIEKQAQRSDSDVNKIMEQVLTDFSRQLTNRLIHAPSRLMREVASEGDKASLELVVTQLKDAYRN